MVILEKMFRLLVALALAIGTFQCAAACTPVSSGCPHHKQAPPRCTHELVPATIVQPSIVSVSFSVEAVETSFVTGALVSLDIPAVQDQSPPESPFFLKI